MLLAVLVRVCSVLSSSLLWHCKPCWGQSKQHPLLSPDLWSCLSQHWARWPSLFCPCSCPLDALVPHILGHNTYEAFLFSYARLWPAWWPSDPPSSEGRCYFCFIFPPRHQEHPDGLQLLWPFRNKREQPLGDTSWLPCSLCSVTSHWLPGVVSNLMLLFLSSTSHPGPTIRGRQPRVLAADLCSGD